MSYMRNRRVELDPRPQWERPSLGRVVTCVLVMLLSVCFILAVVNKLDAKLQRQAHSQSTKKGR